MIKVEGISKKFKFYHSPADRLKEIFFRKKYHKDFVALDNITFEIGGGKTLGIIGQNGAGKSTLLKILSGIIIPDSGTIHVDGKVTGLLELGTGFNYEMTGLENIYMNGTLIGMSREEIDCKRQAIIDFSELGEFIHESIKTYSSGMTMRLAFSIAIHADPKCFLVDEALSVGDAYFQQKCMRKIQEFRANGGSIIFVSHDLNAVKTLCDTALMLDGGRIIDYGEPKTVVDFYQNLMLKKMHQGDIEVSIKRENDDPSGNTNHYHRSGISTNQVEVLSVKILDEFDREISHIESGGFVKVVSKIRSNATLNDPHYGFCIRDKYGSEVYSASTESLNITTAPQHEGEIITAVCSLNLPVSPGDYSICIGVANGACGSGMFEEYCLFIQDVAMIKIIRNSKEPRFGGIVNLNAKMDILKFNRQNTK